MKEKLLIPLIALFLAICVLYFQINRETSNSQTTAKRRTNTSTSRGANGQNQSKHLDNQAAPGKQPLGKLRIRFVASENIWLCVLVLTDEQIERKEWVDIICDSRSDSKYHNDSILLESVPAGRKTVALISEWGYFAGKASCCVESDKTTELVMPLDIAKLEPLVEIHGLVKDMGGKPVEGAKVSLHDEDSAFSFANTQAPTEILSYEGGGAGAIINEGELESSDPYSQESLESLMQPYESPGSWYTTGFRRFANGEIERYNVTADDGAFRFFVMTDKEYILSVESNGIVTNVVAKPGVTAEITIQGGNGQKISFQEIYRTIMTALLTKDNGSFEKITALLRVVPSEENEAIFSKTLARFLELYHDPTDFYSQNLDARRAFIKECSRFAYRTSLLIRMHLKH